MIKKITQEVTTKVIDAQTGELNQETIETSSYVEREPDYVKIYLQDILRLKDLPKSNNSILLAILRRMGYNQEIVMIAPIKKQIAEELGLELITVSKAIEAFCHKDILLRKDRGLYVVNPYYFGRGKWEDIKRIRMTIEYSAKGKMFFVTQLNDEEYSKMEQLELFADEVKREKLREEIEKGVQSGYIDFSKEAVMQEVQEILKKRAFDAV